MCQLGLRLRNPIFLRSLILPRRSVLNLFNSGDNASDQIDQIEEWLEKAISRTERPSDLLIYYTGHGGFTRNDQSYFLAIRRTREGSEGATSIRYVDLASSIKRHAHALRKYLILDCCFAASAIINTQADLNNVIVQRLEDELPPSGTAVLCSSAAKFVSIAPPGERHTMFSGALLECLKSGVHGGPPSLTLEDIGKAARDIIRTRFPSDGVRPEVHVPEQSSGNPARIPLVPNPRWVPSASEDGAAIAPPRLPETSPGMTTSVASSSQGNCAF